MEKKKREAILRRKPSFITSVSGGVQFHGSLKQCHSQLTYSRYVLLPVPTAQCHLTLSPQRPGCVSSGNWRGWKKNLTITGQLAPSWLPSAGSLTTVPHQQRRGELRAEQIPLFICCHPTAPCCSAHCPACSKAPWLARQVAAPGHQKLLAFRFQPLPLPATCANGLVFTARG